VDVVGERLLLAGEAEADLVQEFLGGCTKNIYVPATILLRPATAENTEVQQEQLHLLAHHFARGAENHTLLSRVAIAVEISAKERSDNLFRGAKNGYWDLLLTCARAVRETQFLDEKIRDVLRVN